MKLNVTVFLLKEDRLRINAIPNRSHVNHVEFEVKDCKADFYWKRNSSTPKWSRLFENIDGVEIAKMQGKSVQGVLVLERNDRIFCFTFGHARHLIDPYAIERYFGLKVALSLSDPALIKSIDKTNLDKIPLRSRSQSSKYISITEFDFTFDWEILKSLTGVVEGMNDEDYEVVSGSDSVSLNTNIDLNTLPKLADRLLKAYSDDGYKLKYPWIDYIVPLRDYDLSEELDLLVLDKINNKNYEEIWMAPPEVIDYGNFQGFCYKHRSGNSSQTTHPDLDLESCLRTKGIEGKVSVNNLRNTKIFLYDADDKQLEAWTLYLCLNAELEHNDCLYLLSEGGWYQVERKFSSQINNYFNSFPRSNIDFPFFQGQHEGEYLKKIADGKFFYLMDQKLVKPSEAKSSIEFCDLLTINHEIIHVKKYSNSSVLSHLFSQAYVSAESLLRAPEIISQVNEYLKGFSYKFVFDPAKQPRESKIILAIMQKKHGGLHMPFFSKVNFKQYSQRLSDMGYKVELKKIEY